MNLFPKNHRPELTQTPGKIRSQSRRKWEKKLTTQINEKTHIKVMNPRGREKDSDFLFHSKSQRIHHKIFRFRTSLKNHTEGENLERRGKIRVRHGFGGAISYLWAITQFSECS
jgi:Fe-S cluster biosynthesis and repair protein YggX